MLWYNLKSNFMHFELVHVSCYAIPNVTEQQKLTAEKLEPVLLNQVCLLVCLFYLFLYCFVCPDGRKLKQNAQARLKSLFT